jgi:hypothetical protein
LEKYTPWMMFCPASALMLGKYSKAPRWALFRVKERKDAMFKRTPTDAEILDYLQRKNKPAVNRLQFDFPELAPDEEEYLNDRGDSIWEQAHAKFMAGCALAMIPLRWLWGHTAAAWKFVPYYFGICGLMLNLQWFFPGGIGSDPMKGADFNEQRYFSAVRDQCGWGIRLHDNSAACEAMRTAYAGMAAGVLPVLQSIKQQVEADRQRYAWEHGLTSEAPKQ